MTLEEIKERVQAIEEEAAKEKPDHEWPHIVQDNLYLDFIKSIAEMKVESIDKIYLIRSLEVFKEQAQEIIKVDDIDFPRWYA